MSTKLELDLSEFAGLALHIERAAKKIVDQVAREAVAVMELRIARGENVADDKMPAYSRRYKRIREEENLTVDLRNMDFSGEMLQSMHVTRVRRSPRGFVAEIGFGTARARGLALYNMRRGSKYVFFGFSPKDQKQIAALLRRKMQRIAPT